MRFSFTLLLACTLNLSHIPIVWGQEDPVPKTADGRFPLNKAFCEAAIGNHAALIMRSRLRGDSMSDTEQYLEKIGANESDYVSKIVAEEMMLTALESPRWNTPENQKRAVEEFRNKWTVACLRAPR